MASKDQLIGGLILAASLVGICVYAWLLYAYALIVLQATAFIAITAILGILAWIGYALATTPPPKPIEEIEEEIEKEIKKETASGELSKEDVKTG